MQTPHQLPHCSGFANTELRDAHFQKHAKAHDNAIEYERAGITFMNTAIDEYNQGRFTEGVYPVLRPDGGFAVTFWDDEDNLGLFGSMDKNGRLRTFLGITSQKEFTSLSMSKVFK